MTVICPNLFYDGVCYKETALYLAIYMFVIQNHRSIIRNVICVKVKLFSYPLI